MRMTAFYLNNDVIDNLPLEKFLTMFSTNREGGLVWNSIKADLLNNYNKNHRKTFVSREYSGLKCFFCTGYSKQHLEQALKENRTDKSYILELNTPYKVDKEKEIMVATGMGDKPQRLVIKEEYPVDYLFNTAIGTELLKITSSNNKQFIKLDGDMIKLTSDRLILFKHKGCKCVKCGIEGNYLVKLKSNGQNCYHLELFHKKNNDYILMTKDHIIPKSLGGADKLENFQTMCIRCNMQKSNSISKDNIQKGSYKRKEYYKVIRFYKKRGTLELHDYLKSENITHHRKSYNNVIDFCIIDTISEKQFSIIKNMADKYCGTIFPDVYKKNRKEN